MPSDPVAEPTEPPPEPRPLTARIDAAALQPTLPRRRYRLVLDLHADDLNALCHALLSLAFDIEHDGITVRTSGGYSDGSQAELTDYGPGVTHDRYIAELDEWWRQRRQEDHRA